MYRKLEISPVLLSGILENIGLLYMQSLKHTVHAIDYKFLSGMLLHILSYKEIIIVLCEFFST